MQRLAVLLCALFVGCVLPAVPDEELGTLAPPCASGWTPTADGRRCERPRDGGSFDAHQSPDAHVPEEDGGGIDSGMIVVADGGHDAAIEPGHDAGPPDVGTDAGPPRCYQPATGGPPPDASVPLGPVLNEYVFKHNMITDLGTDYFEYVEIYGPPGVDYSDLTVLVVASHDGTNPGTIQRAVEVGETNAAGFWRSCFGYEDGDDAFPQASATIFLVRGFTAAEGYDLDSGNDGVLDATPWTEILDEVAFEDSSSLTDVFYSTVRLTYDGYVGHEYTGSRLGASRIADGYDTNSEEDWRKNHYTGSGLPGVTGSPRTGEAYNTPGAPNRIQ